MPQQNTQERREMLAARAVEQRSRSAGFTPMRRQPANWPRLEPWKPAGRFVLLERPPVIPAHINPKTMVPHQNRRARFRGYPPVRLAQVAYGTA